MQQTQDDFEWLSARDAILRRPDTHAGTTQLKQIQRVVLAESGVTVVVEGDYCPALLKIFDEIFTNAIDHSVRDPKMTELHVSIEPDGLVVISNNGGTSIPTGLWGETGRHIPEIIFTELNAGSNLSVVNAHNVGGRNGVGATVAAIFSTKFSLEICNSVDGVKYEQLFEHNLGKVHPPRLTKYKNVKSKTTISFMPDYARLNMPNGLDANARALLVGRAVDATACTSVRVHVNSTVVPYKSFQAYATAFGGTVIGSDKVTSSPDDPNAIGCSIIVTNKADPPVQLCLVNGVRCTGTLFHAVMQNICAALVGKHKEIAKQAATIVSENVSVFVVARINTPDFGSQSKDLLETPVSKFGFTVPACTTISKRVVGLDGVTQQVQLRKGLADNKAAKKALTGNGGKLCKDIKKLERATEVGRGKQCTLWVAEGDSAKAMIVSGFAAIGRKYNGVYPLRGKLLNVYDSSATDALKNTEISELLAILNLDPTKTYDATSVKKLPYNLMVTTDSDDDGSHIFGLVMAMFYRFFPTVLRSQPGFVKRFVTPVVKVHLTARAAPMEFFALSAYRAWAAANASVKPSSIAYYKGLGTNTNAEAVAYFGNMSVYSKETLHTDECVNAMRVAFSKAKEQICARADLIRSISANATHDLYSANKFSMQQFCHEELPLFWQADNLRSIPSVIDGAKPSQRKVLFTILKRGKDAKHKVAQLAADVAKDCNYHHGEASLADVVTKMAQTQFGSNNLNLLQPLGQYGNRHGEKPSQPRYIFTKAQPWLQLLFHPDDRHVLCYLEDEGMSIEPDYFAPVLPLLLINGSEGIGTGFSTMIPPHALGDVIDRCLSICDHGIDTELDPLVPHVHGFTGETFVSDTSVEFFGVYTWIDATTVSITELPPGLKTNKLKDCLHDEACIDDVVPHHVGDTVDLRVKFKVDAIPPKDQLEKMLKLKSSMSLTNMHAFDAAGHMVKYASSLDILRAYARVRLDLYEARKAELIRKAQERIDSMMIKLGFMERVVAKEIKPFDTPRGELLTLLAPHGAELLALSLALLTPEGVAEYKEKIRALEAEVVSLGRMTAQGWWRDDIYALRDKIDCASVQAPPAKKRLAATVPDAAIKRKKTTEETGTTAEKDDPMDVVG